jgi:hypothetical protein
MQRSKLRVDELHYSITLVGAQQDRLRDAKGGLRIAMPGRQKTLR